MALRRLSPLDLCVSRALAACVLWSFDRITGGKSALTLGQWWEGAAEGSLALAAAAGWFVATFPPFAALVIWYAHLQGVGISPNGFGWLPVLLVALAILGPLSNLIREYVFGIDAWSLSLDIAVLLIGGVSGLVAQMIMAR